MGLIERDYIQKRHNKNNISNKKWSDGLDSKKYFESELNRMCDEKHRQKEYKRDTFNQNIKPHIVYMDENGNIPLKSNSHFTNVDRKTPKQLQEELKNNYVRKKIINILIALIIVFLILYLSYDLYMSGTMIF